MGSLLHMIDPRRLLWERPFPQLLLFAVVAAILLQIVEPNFGQDRIDFDTDQPATVMASSDEEYRVWVFLDSIALPRLSTFYELVQIEIDHHGLPSPSLFIDSSQASSGHKEYPKLRSTHLVRFNASGEYIVTASVSSELNVGRIRLFIRQASFSDFFVIASCAIWVLIGFGYWFMKKKG